VITATSAPPLVNAETNEPMKDKEDFYMLPTDFCNMFTGMTEEEQSGILLHPWDRYFVLEFVDDPKLTEDQYCTLIWYLKKHKGYELMIVCSDGAENEKPVAWFHISHLTKKQLNEFVTLAVELGADLTKFANNQGVCVPGTINAETGKRRVVYYFDPYTVGKAS
jgi:hypothetical protein